MKQIILSASIVVLCCNNIVAQEKVKVETTNEKIKIKSVNGEAFASDIVTSDSAEANLLKSMSVKWMDAMLNHDSVMLIKLMSPEYKLHPWDGTSSVPRDRWISTLLNKLRITKWEQTSLHAKVYGDVGVVNSFYKWAGTHTERPFEAAGHLTDVWVKVRGNWVVVSRSSERFPDGGTLMK